MSSSPSGLICGPCLRATRSSLRKNPSSTGHTDTARRGCKSEATIAGSGSTSSTQTLVSVAATTFTPSTREVASRVPRDMPPTGGLAVFPKPEELAGYTYCRAFPFRCGPRIMVAALCCIDNTALLSRRMDDGGLVLLEVDHESGLLKAISGVVVKQLHDFHGSNSDYHLPWVVMGVNLLVFLEDFYFLRPVAFDIRCQCVAGIPKKLWLRPTVLHPFSFAIAELGWLLL
ncbi:hypothetical protein SELMODRAFT_402094 [Selaginella moellendorffii]|uniref:Uncharacterized protein n=1 Tax=Selaginella moellendorffii TaxID=88036 RepID=D8QPK2_SELML|nr:hypothetical protein SELMODRAFT_402094 [Selaginella moellendorffii]